MRFYLKSQGLWNVVVFDSDPPPLTANPIIAQMKAHEEKKLKKDKVITCLHSGLAYHMFFKIAATQFLTHVLINFQKKNPKIAKNIENPKNIFFNIFASFLKFLASSQKNLNFQRF